MVVACRQDEVLFQPAAMATNTQPKPCPISSPHSREDCSWTVAASCLVDDDTTWRLKGARRNRRRGSAEGLLRRVRKYSGISALRLPEGNCELAALRRRP